MFTNLMDEVLKKRKQSYTKEEFLRIIKQVVDMDKENLSLLLVETVGASWLLAINGIPHFGFMCLSDTSQNLLQPLLAPARTTDRPVGLLGSSYCQNHSHTKIQDTASASCILVETVGVEPTSKTDDNILLRV